MKRLLLLIGCLSALFFTACQKELSDNFTAYTNNPLNDTIWHRNLPSGASIHDILNALLPDNIVDSFEISKDTTLKYGDSLSVSIPANCFAGPGTTGKARLEILRLKKKGDYIKTFKPTTSNGYLLETGGAFFIRVIKDGKELALAPNQTIKIRFSDIEDTKLNLQVFYGKENIPPPVTGIDTAFNWVRDTDTSWIKTFQATAGTGLIKGYEMLIRNLRWVGAERYIDSTQPKAKITAILAPNYTSDNTAVFAVFNNQKTIVWLRSDFASRSFAANNIPLKSSIKLISLSKIGDDFFLGTKDVNDVGTITAYKIEPEKKALKDIIAFLNGL